MSQSLTEDNEDTSKLSDYSELTKIKKKIIPPYHYSLPVLQYNSFYVTATTTVPEHLITINLMQIINKTNGTIPGQKNNLKLEWGRFGPR
jgi:hypothetical protein